MLPGVFLAVNEACVKGFNRIRDPTMILRIGCEGLDETSPRQRHSGLKPRTQHRNGSRKGQAELISVRKRLKVRNLPVISTFTEKKAEWVFTGNY